MRFKIGVGMPNVTEQTVEIPFDGGLKEGEESLLQTEGFQVIENCIRTKDGGFRKIRGFVDVPTALTNSLANRTSMLEVRPPADDLLNPRVVARGSTFAYASKGILWVTASGQSAGRYPQGWVSPWVLEQETVMTSERADRFDVCVSGGVVYFATVDNNVSGGTSITIVARDWDSGKTLFESSVTGIGILSGPRLVPWQGASQGVFLLYRDGTELNIVRVITGGSFASGPATVAVGLPANFPFDAVGDAAGTRLYVSFASTTANVRTLSYDTSSGSPVVISNQDTFCSDVTAISVCLNESTGRILVAHADWTGADPNAGQRVRAVVIATSTMTPVNPILTLHTGLLTGFRTLNFDAVIKQISTVVTDVDWCVFHTDPNQVLRGGDAAQNVQVTRARMVSSNGATAGFDSARCYNARMCSRVYYDSSHNRCYFLAHLSQDSTVGIASVDPNRQVMIMGVATPPDGDLVFGGNNDIVPFGVAGYLSAQVYKAESGLNSTGYIEQLASWYRDSSGAVHFAYRAEDSSVAFVRDLRLVEDARVGVHAQFGAQTYIAGAMLWQWDGWRTLEAQFLQQPFIVGPQYAAGALLSGSRYYKVTFLRVSQTGERTRSRPSDSVLYSNAVGQLNVVEFNRINVTAAQQNAEFEEFWYEIWRTKAGESGPFYLLARLPGTLYQLRAGSHIVYNDATPDGSLMTTALAQDGALGAELANDQPPSAAHICRWNNRLWVTDGDQIWYSKERAVDRSAEFSGFQALERGGIEGRIVALARSGETLTVFGRDETGYIYGEPASANGTGSSLTGPVLVQGRIGCLYPAALCDIPQGTLVPTRYGVQLYTLQREYQQVGIDAEDSLGLSGAELTSAVYDQSDDLAWIAAEDRFVLLDCTRLKWSTAFTGQSVVSVTLAGGNLVISGENYIAQRDGAGYTFRGSFFGQAVETPWLKAGGVLGEMRARKLWLLAQNYGASSGLFIQVAYDYNTTWVDGMNISEFQLSSTELASAVRVIRLAMNRQRCRSFKVRIAESLAGPADSAGYGLLALRLAFAARAVKGTGVRESNSGGGLT